MSAEPRRREWVKHRSLGRRSTDRKWPRHLRDFWMVIITGLVTLALAKGFDAIGQVQQGRRTATAVQCAILSAVSDSGRVVIAQSSTASETPFTRNLEKLGYPPLAVRRAQASAAGRAYVASISRHVEREIGHRGDRLINADGTVNCDRFARLANIPLGRRAR